MSDEAVPRFAVVGHPNKGKSSIVATLAQDDSVYIDRISGTTRESRHYPMQVDGEALYELVDTPGFQRARAVLGWLEEHCRNVAERPQAVRAFCVEKADDPAYFNECQLLQPLLEGAAIIYVVDGSHPYGPEYQAEMEILRWTGQPSLALINPIDSDQFVAQWEVALGQYFRTVRVFDAHRAPFPKRISLLTLFGQLQPGWEPALERAVTVLKEERCRQHRQAAEAIADMLVEALQYRTSQRFPEGMPRDGAREALAARYQRHLAQLEREARARVEEIYAYYRLERQEGALAVLDRDLFDQRAWYLFGLSKGQLVSAATATGASAGAALDVGLGGSTLFLGSLAGGLAGGAGAWRFAGRIAQLRFKGLPAGGVILQYGPWEHPNFPFVLLGRALRHQQLICTRTHANRDVLDLQQLESEQPFQHLGQRDRSTLLKIFTDIRRRRHSLRQREKLVDTIYRELKSSRQQLATSD